MQQKQLQGTLTTIKAYIRKKEKYQTNNLTLYLKKPEKEKQTKLRRNK